MSGTLGVRDIICTQWQRKYVYHHDGEEAPEGHVWKVENGSQQIPRRGLVKAEERE